MYVRELLPGRPLPLLLRAWRWDDWNELRIRCEDGALLALSTRIDGVLIAWLNTATLVAPGYAAAAVAAHFGDRRQIALEVHDNDEQFADARWEPWGGPSMAPPLDPGTSERWARRRSDRRGEPRAVGPRGGRSDPPGSAASKLASEVRGAQ